MDHKKSRLDGARCYVSGAMDRAKDGGWGGEEKLPHFFKILVSKF
jgi:hypothetical protein